VPSVPDPHPSTRPPNRYARGQAPVVSIYSEAQLLAPRTSLGNAIIELPGSDLADEIVVIGGHIDSWVSACCQSINLRVQHAYLHGI
jgi:hypothetical protein